MAALVAIAVAAAACSSPPRSTPAPSTSPTPLTPTHAGLLMGPGWFVVVVTVGSAPAAYGLSLSRQTAVQVPGYGSLTLEQTRAQGGRALVASAVSGLLGIGLDRSDAVADAAPPPLAGGAAYDSLPIRPTPSQVQALVTAHLGAARLTVERAFGRKIELRNGSGSATAAHQATLLLAADGYQIVRQVDEGGKAKPSTQIVVYSGTEGSVRVGNDAAGALGVGSVVTATQTPQDRTLPTPQSDVVVDVTVILGTDFAAQQSEM